jgi:ribosomal protein L25 (general stress protein Ctc)
MANAKKPTKKAGPKKRAMKRRAAEANTVPDVIPMAEFVVVVNNPSHRAMRLSAEAGLTQYIQITLDGRADKALIRELIADPGRVHIINIPETQVMAANNLLLTPGKICSLLPKELRSRAVQAVAAFVEAVQHLKEQDGEPDPRLPDLILYWDDRRQVFVQGVRDEDFVNSTAIPPWTAIDQLKAEGKIASPWSPKFHAVLDELRKVLESQG